MSGRSAQIGYAKEVTAGTAVTVTQFVPLVTESMSESRERLESDAIVAGRRFLTSPQYNGGNISVSGDVGHELFVSGTTLLFEAMIGSRSTTGAGPFVHTITPGTLPSLTCQIGKPDSAGTVHPFTFAGCKVGSWEIACSAGQIATLGLTLAGMTATTATALAAASYGTRASKPFKFNHASVTIAAGSAAVRGFTLSGDNALDTDRRDIGSQTIKTPLEMGLRTVSGSLEMEFLTLTEYNRYVNASEFAVVFTFTAGPDIVAITLNARYDGDTPTVGDMGLLTQTLPFKAIASGADPTAITAVLTNAESMA